MPISKLELSSVFLRRKFENKFFWGLNFINNPSAILQCDFISTQEIANNEQFLLPSLSWHKKLSIVHKACFEILMIARVATDNEEWMVPR